MDGNLARELDRADQELDLLIERRHEQRVKLNAQAQAERMREESYLRGRMGRVLPSADKDR